VRYPQLTRQRPLQLKSHRQGTQRLCNRRTGRWRQVSTFSKETAMQSLPIKEHIALAAMGTLASACTLAVAVLVPLIA
jgi:hypothetical protein